MAFAQMWELVVPIWTTRGRFIAKIYLGSTKVGSMNMFNEQILGQSRQQGCRILSGSRSVSESWQTWRVGGLFKNPVAQPGVIDHLRRSLIGGGFRHRSASEGLKPAQGFDCVLLQNRGVQRGMLGGM